MIAESVKKAYPTIKMEEYLTYDEILEQVPSSSKFKMEEPVSMENLPMNSDSGQSYGYTIYRKVADFSDGANFEVKFFLIHIYHIYNVSKTKKVKATFLAPFDNLGWSSERLWNFARGQSTSSYWFPGWKLLDK